MSIANIIKLNHLDKYNAFVNYFVKTGIVDNESKILSFYDPRETLPEDHERKTEIHQRNFFTVYLAEVCKIYDYGSIEDAFLNNSLLSMNDSDYEADEKLEKKVFKIVKQTTEKAKR